MLTSTCAAGPRCPGSGRSRSAWPRPAAGGGAGAKINNWAHPLTTSVQRAYVVHRKEAGSAAAACGCSAGGHVSVPHPGEQLCGSGSGGPCRGAAATAGKRATMGMVHVRVVRSHGCLGVSRHKATEGASAGRRGQAAQLAVVQSSVTAPPHVRARKVDLEEVGVGVRHLHRAHEGLPQEVRHVCCYCRVLPPLGWCRRRCDSCLVRRAVKRTGPAGRHGYQ